MERLCTPTQGTCIYKKGKLFNFKFDLKELNLKFSSVKESEIACVIYRDAQRGETPELVYPASVKNL